MLGFRIFGRALRNIWEEMLPLGAMSGITFVAIALAPLLVVAGSVDRLLLQSATAHSASWTGLLPNMQEVALYVVSLGESTPYTLTVQVTNPANATKQADEK